MAVIAFGAVVYLIIVGVSFGNEKSQTMNMVSKDFNTDLYKKEKELSKKMKKEGYKISGEASEEEYDDEDYDDEDEDIDEDEEFTCDNCGATVSEDAKKCPKCEVIFNEEEVEDEEESSDSDISVDDKFNSLVKLKELLDKDIITKEEFDKEKKKILGK